MTRTLTITVNEWESVRDGHLWIVRDAYRTYLNLRAISSHPPADLLAAAAPCETCGGNRRLWHIGTVATGPSEWRGCPDCRITLVGECPTCHGDGCDIDFCLDCGDEYEDPCKRHAIHEHAPCGECCPQCSGPAQLGTVVLGCAYPASEVLPVFDRYGVCDVGLPEEWMPHITIDADFGEVLACTRDPKYRNEWLEVSIDLAHYGDPAGLVGKWALQLAVQP